MSNHAENEKKPIYKKWWFWLIVLILVIGIAGTRNNNTEESSNNNKYYYQKSNVAEVTVTDFSTMTRENIQDWFNTNKINGKISEEYSESIAKGDFVSQSIVSNTTIHEGDKITVTFSLGKEPTKEEKNALKKAESYSEMMHMSKKAIYNQLTSEYGEKFSASSAQYAIDNIEADWNSNALEKAKDYQNTMNMSKSKIYDQLISEYGEKFTKSEAQYAIDHLND